MKLFFSSSSSTSSFFGYYFVIMAMFPVCKTRRLSLVELIGAAFPLEFVKLLCDIISTWEITVQLTGKATQLQLTLRVHCEKCRNEKY